MKIFILVLLVCLSFCVKIEEGTLEVQIKSPAVSGSDKFRVNIDSQIRSQLKLTQSSIIQISAQVKFSQANFQPQLFSFRLVHGTYDSITEPVLAKYNEDDDGLFKATIDLGDPKTIKPYSDVYQLELILSDEKLEKSLRKKIANTKITFRHSVEHVSQQYNQYSTQSIIRSDPPSTRVDPPQTFTAFILAVDIIITLLFIFGLSYLKVNIKLLLSSGKGLILNVVLIGLLLVNMVFLFKFWQQWTFINTVQNFIILLVPTALVANYAFLSLKK